MKDYVAENERILNEWCDCYVKNNQSSYPNCTNLRDYFAPDGIMNKGEFDIKPDGTIIRKPSNMARSTENSMWNECPLRVLFLTKDENTDGDVAWDVRAETFYKKGNGLPPKNKTISDSFFFRNEACILYGLLNTTLDNMIMCSDKDFSWEDALRFSDEKIFARVNCKKEVGYSTISDRVLKESIDKYFDNLKEQILKIDADIFVCCGHQKDDNLILNTVYDIYENEFEYVNCVDGKGTGMHYNAKRNKLAIDAYHLSFIKGGIEARYNETVGMYYEFLKYLKQSKKYKNVDFSATHRI